MLTTPTATAWNDPKGQALLGVFGCVIVGILGMVGGIPAFLIAISVIVLPPRMLILGFVCFSYFRIHEAYPFLVPLKLPLVFSAASIAAIAFMFCNPDGEVRKDRPIWLALAGLSIFLSADVLFLIGSVSQDYAPRLPIAVAMLLASIAMYCCYRALDTMNAEPFGREIILFLGLFCVVTLGIAFAQNPGIALEYWKSTYWKVAAMTLVLAWLLRSALDFRTSLWMLICSGGLIALVTCFNWYFGIDLVEGNRVTIGRTLFSTPEQIANAIPGSPVPGGSRLGDPNDLALVLLFPVSLALAAIVKLGHRTAIGRMCCVILPLLIAAIIMTKSRGGALGVIAVFGSVGLFYIRSKMLLIALALVGMVGLVVVMDIASRKSGGRAEIESAGIDRSALERLHAWAAATKMTVHYPLTGVGMHNFPSQFRAYTPVWSGRNMAAHSTWFGVMSETGLPGIALLIWVILAVLAALRRTWAILQRQTADPVFTTFCLGLTAGMVGFCASGTFLSQGFGWPLYLLIGFSAALATAVRKLAAAAERAP